MDQTREQLDQQIKPSTGISGDVKRLKTDTSASVEELRDFVANLKGRSPQEVLGLVTGNSLFQGVTQATIGCVVLLAVTTVLPWAFDDGLSAEERETVTATAEMVKDSDAAAAAADSEPAVAATDGGSDVGDVDPASAAAAMGIDEVKPADSSSNPLDADSKLDNLLDGLN